MAEQPRILEGVYELRERLGSGGGGVVYKAWHRRLQKDVVLKELRAGTAAGRAVQRAEADILKGLKHSYLPQVYDFVTDGEQVYTVMEYIPGFSLDKLLKEGRRFSQQQVIKWARQLCEALAYMHGQKTPVLHADIKPGNIMRTPAGDVCLIDFNIALVLGEGVEQIYGSPGYASPEHYGSPDISANTPVSDAQPEDGTQLLDSDSDSTIPLYQSQQPSGEESGKSKKRTVLNTRSDVYSLGATLYHLLVGEKPASNAKDVKPLKSFPFEISESLIYIIERAMSPDPARRFPSAKQMLAALNGIQKLDKRWRGQVLRQNIIAGLTVAIFAVSGLSVFTGWRLMALEKEEAYQALSYSIEHGEDVFAEAVALFPGRVDAYYSKALSLMNQNDIAACRDFIQSSMPALRVYELNTRDVTRLGDLYYILANCYFEDEDYANAAVYYLEALNYNQSNIEMYRDYAIALCRCGQIEQAEVELAAIEGMGLDSSLDLLRAEIAYAKGNDAQAAAFCQNLISVGSDTVLYRAFRVCSDAYKRVGDAESDIALLKSASRLPARYANEFTERLADAYMRAGKTAEAIDCFQTLAKTDTSFHIRENLVILYEQIEDFVSAERELNLLADAYPQNYRVPMRMAFLQADMQSKMPNETRDYARVFAEYERAAALYNAQKKAGDADVQMQQLENVIEQLKAGGWLQ